MDQSLSRVRVEEIESSLAEVGEIKAARVVVGSEGVIQEIHVLALPTKPPKQLVRDIESTIMARFGLPVDHRKISIAQIGREAVQTPEPATAPAEERPSAVRPRIISLNSNVTGLRASASVTLEMAGAEYIGQASGPASQTGRVRQVALATLDALDQYVSESTTFSLEDVAIVQLGRERVAVSCVCLVTQYGEQSFTGSALVRQSDNDSVVRATLDAINRRMGLLKTE